MITWQEILSDITDRLPPPEDPRTYSFFLAHLSHVFMRYHNSFEKSFYHRYNQSMIQYKNVRFPNGKALIARGMDNLRPSSNLLERIADGDIRSCADEWLGGDMNPINALEGIKERGKCLTSWSENVVTASASFATHADCSGGRRLLRRIRKMRPIRVGAVCMIGLIPTERIISFGGDSESGVLDEAEVYVESPVPAPYIRAYVVTDNPAYKQIGKVVTRAEQRYYGLSCHFAAKVHLDDMYPWPSTYIVLLHPDTDLSLFGDRLRGVVRREVRDDWRRVE